MLAWNPVLQLLNLSQSPNRHGRAFCPGHPLLNVGGVRAESQRFTQRHEANKKVRDELRGRVCLQVIRAKRTQRRETQGLLRRSPAWSSLLRAFV